MIQRTLILVYMLAVEATMYNLVSGCNRGQAMSASFICLLKKTEYQVLLWYKNTKYAYYNNRARGKCKIQRAADISLGAKIQTDEVLNAIKSI